MKTRLLTCVLLLSLISVAAFAQNNPWTEVQPAAVQNYLRSKQNALPQAYRLVQLNRAMAEKLRLQAPMETTATAATPAARFDLPLPDGSFLPNALLESPVLSNALQSRLPGVKTYELTNPVNKSVTGRLTVTPEGITGLLFTDQGSAYIAPLGKEYPDVHMVYYVKDVKPPTPVACGVKEELSNMRGSSVLSGDCMRRTYRIAVAATGEYTTWAGSQANALTYITITVNNITAIYERDANIRFTLVTNNSIIFTDATTDPYATSSFPTTTTLNTNNTTINSALGSGGYDLGIVFNNGWDGGLAQLSSVCGTSKGRAAAGLTFGTGANPTAGPQGPVFDGTVAHEVAHQFSATHTFAATNGSCAGNNTAATAYEPGGGSTLMAYAGTCTGNAYQNNSDLYFHGGNILQIQSFATGAGNACTTPTATGNNAPVVTVPAASYTIPVSTPFILTASATDADANTLTYNWEQVDAGFLTSTPPAPTNTSGPQFRSYPSSTVSSRTFPRLADIVAGVSPTYEVLPSVARTMNFLVTVRDNAAGGGCTDEATVAVTTDAGSGPFVVTSQNTTTTWTANGSNTAIITWNVANTNAVPVNCTNVAIKLSVDGGLTYPYTLLANTANDGTETIVIPNLPTSVGRVRVEAINNIFFNINSGNITIASSCSAEGATVTPATTVTGNQGNAALDLTLSPLYGNLVNITGTLASTDPVGFLAVNNTTPGVCVGFTNNFQYDLFRFTVNVAGNYTFTRSGSTSTLIIFDLYNGDYTGSNPCSNFLNSNGTYANPPNSVSIGSNFTATLTPGIYYTIAVGTFSTGSPAVPANYTINVTPPAGGALYDNTPSPGAGFSYTYVIVNNATGIIKAIDPGANLSNGTTFPLGTYTVYGLSYSNSISLATLNSYVGGQYSVLVNDILYNPTSLCSNASKNSVTVNIIGTLPVQLLPLEGYKIGRTVLLKWTTLSENNSALFDVLHSTDGNNFTEVIGTLAAKGNSQSRSDYSLVHKTPGDNWNYYRLRQVDKDGKSVLGNIVRINMAAPSSILTLFPNPVRSETTVQYVSEERANLQLVVLDSKGAEVMRLAFATQPGMNTKVMNMSKLAKGVYAVELIGSNGTQVSRFIKE